MATIKNPEARNKTQDGCKTKNLTNDMSSNPWKCDECHESFTTVFAKKKHEKYYHFVSKPYMCECGQQFGKLSEVNYHIRRIHNQEKNFACPQCSKAFFKHSDLISHLNTHEASGKYLCKECGRRFKHVSNLIRHSRTHSGVRPYPCFVCNKRFTQIAALRQHEISEEHKAKCTISEVGGANCDNSETAAMMLEGSEQFQLEDKSVTDQKENSNNLQKDKKWWFYCKVCGERFPYSVMLRDHEIKHVLNKDVSCNSCGKNFLTVMELKEHACTSYEDQLERKSMEEALHLDNTLQLGDSLQLDHLQIPEKLDDPPQYSEMLPVPIQDPIMELREPEQDKKIELTLSQDGQIMLDNDEVLLTLNDKVYGLVLINNDVTILDDEECLQAINKPPDLLGGSTTDDRLAVMDSWLNSMTLGDITPDPQPETALPDAQVVESKPSKSRKSKPTHEFTCSECGKVFNKKGNYQQHLGIHFIKMQKHKCQECERYFAWKSTLRKHIIKEHAEKTDYTCQQCGKLYHSNVLVQHHIKRDHLNIRSHKCSSCGKSFFRRYDLKIHTRTHTDERPYICGTCGKTFRHLSHSIRHEKMHAKPPSPAKPQPPNGVIMFNHNTLAV